MVEGNLEGEIEHWDLFEEVRLYVNRLFSGIFKTQNLSIPSLLVIFQAFIGSFVGILVLSYIDYTFLLDKSDFIMIVGSFGAQAVLIFATPNVPLAQPWNCIFGNGVGSFIGVSCYKIFYNTVDNIDDWIWVASAAAVSLSIVVMLLTKSLHPPAGATALIAVQGSQRVHDLGYYYVLFPAIIASSIHVAIGIILNNLSKDNIRSYPVVMIPYQFKLSHSLFTALSVKNLDNPEEDPYEHPHKTNNFNENNNNDDNNQENIEKNNDNNNNNNQIENHLNEIQMNQI